MLPVTESREFSRWFDRLRDRAAQLRVASWIARVRAGNLGDVRPVGQGISEHRMHVGPGYRIYFMQRGTHLVVLLTGGDKSTQASDIEKAKAIAAKWEQRK